MLEKQYAVTACAESFAINTDRSSPEQHSLVDQIVDHALRTKRVCLIIDGLNQMPAEDCKHFVEIHSAADRDSTSCHWIVLSRVHTIDEDREGNRIFDDQHWRRVRINPFSPDQQDQYFRIPDHQGRVIGEHWTQTLADRQAMGELLGLPMILWMIRLLIEESESLPVFSTMSQLYLITSRKLLARAIDKNSTKVEEQLSKLGVSVPVFRNEADKLEVLEHVLSLIAFQMMLMENYNGSLLGKDPVERLLTLSEYRYTKDIRDRFEKAREFDRRRIERERDAAETQWTWAIEVVRTIELSHRSVIEAHSEVQIAFRSRKILECHSARYLTRYATPWDIFATNDPSDMPTVKPDDLDQDLLKLCAWNYTTHPQWEDLWSLAIEMPQEPITSAHQGGIIQGAVLDPVVTCRSLSALFRQPKKYAARDIRPTQLIYMAWHLFEYNDPLPQRRLFDISGELKRGADLPQDLRNRLGQRMLLGQTT